MNYESVAFSLPRDHLLLIINQPAAAAAAPHHQPAAAADCDCIHVYTPMRRCTKTMFDVFKIFVSFLAGKFFYTFYYKIE